MSDSAFLLPNGARSDGNAGHAGAAAAAGSVGARAVKPPQPKSLVVALLFFALLSVVLAITLAIELSNRAPASVDRADCVLSPVNAAEHNVSGVIRFERTAEGTRVSGSVSGLVPLREHGVHIHTFGDSSGLTLGPIFNPGHKPHGCLNSAERQVGDLGNLLADDAGTGHLDHNNVLVQLGGEWSVLGRALAIKDEQDRCEPLDFRPGNSIAHCTIEVVGDSGL